MSYQALIHPGSIAAARSGRLLVVDDEPMARHILTRAAAALGFQSESAGSIEEAIACCAADPCDVVVLDLSLRDQDGLMLLRHLAQHGDPVLVFVSGKDRRVLAAASRLAALIGLRVAGTLRKPVTPGALAEALGSAPTRQAQLAARQRDSVNAEALAEAIAQDDIAVEFQPKVSIQTGRVVGVEALARWFPAGRKPVAPDDFIAVAEQGGLIGALTDRVMDHSLRACAAWRRRAPDCTVAVNISPRLLCDPDLPDRVDTALRKHRLPPGALVLEITESVPIPQGTIPAEILTRLRIRGVGLSMDDFGTGHSSLLSLLRLPFGELKLDRSLVTVCDTDAEAAKIVRATASMAHELGISLVAEGVETRSIEEVLRRARCGVGQGWHYGRSLTEANLFARLAMDGQ